METEQLSWVNSARLILCHVHRSSSRMLFLRHKSGSIIAPEPLPFLSTLLEEGDADPKAPAVFFHPAVLILDYCAKSGLPPDFLQAEGEFHERVDTPEQTLSIYLARFSSIDPPKALYDERGGRFCAITELRGGHPAEMALLRLAYQAVIG